ncbi:MAG: hypothetical protein JSW52_10550 [Candidatus Coatesbacteria bacterium]|nr:MAG: hypothetical protein JSW52_10550 [Candidatus Coatesbacteria bacterium]
MWCGFFWGYVFLICLALYAYLDFRNLLKLGVYAKGNSFLGWALGIVLMFIIFFPFYLYERFKKIKRFKEAGGELNDAVTYFAVGYIFFFLILCPVTFVLICVSLVMLESAPQ